MASNPIQESYDFLRSGRSKLQNGDFTRAIDDFTAIIDMADVPAGTRQEAFKFRAIAREAAGDKGGAMADLFDRAAEMNPGAINTKPRVKEFRRRRRYSGAVVVLAWICGFV